MLSSLMACPCSGLRRLESCEAASTVIERKELQKLLTFDESINLIFRVRRNNGSTFSSPRAGGFHHNYAINTPLCDIVDFSVYIAMFLLNNFHFLVMVNPISTEPLQDTPNLRLLGS